ELSTTPAPGPRLRPPRRRIALLAAALACVAVAALAVIVLRTPGVPAEFVVDTDDPDMAFRVDGKGGVLLEDRKENRRYQLKVGRHNSLTGEYEIDVTDPVAGLQFGTRTLTIKRGERVALKASLRATEESVLPAGVTGIDREWIQSVARLSAGE